MTSKEIEQLKASILPTEELFKGSAPINLSEDICEHTNCYAYSLGITYYRTDNMPICFNPGFTNHSACTGKEVLMEFIRLDLINLGISYRQIALNGDKRLEEDEYLIKVFYTEPFDGCYYRDYHLVRCDPNTGIWFHKFGGHNQPEVIISSRKYEFNHSYPGAEPHSIIQHGTNGDVLKYTPLGYFAIKEKQ